MNRNRIIGIPTTTLQSGNEVTSKDYVLSLINDLSYVYVDRADSLKMLGNLNMNDKEIKNLKDPTEKNRRSQ